MAVRQYIGARYVPIYLGAWDITKTYEPLSVVTDGTGNSWTSRKLVPSGTPLVEGEFWAMTGVFSGQILALETRVTQVEQNVEAFNEQFAAKIAEIDEQFDSVDSAITAVRNIAQNAANLAGTARNDAAAAAALARSYNAPRKYILLGDSFGAGYVAGGTNSPYGFLSYAKTQWGSNVYTFSNISGLTGNSGFTTSLSFIRQYDEIVGAMTEDERRQITDVTVLAGTNDYQADAADIRSAVKAFCNRVRVMTPRAVIAIGLLGTAIVKTPALIATFKEAVTISDAIWIDGLYNLFCDPAFLSDAVHLTNDGYRSYAQRILRTIEARQCDFCFIKNLPMTYETGVANMGATTGTTIRQTTSEDIVTETIGQAAVGGWGLRVNSSKITGAYTNVFKIGTVSQPLMSYPPLVNNQFGSALACQDGLPVGYASFYIAENGTDVMVQLHAVFKQFDTNKDVTFAQNIQQQSVLRTAK